MANIKSAKKRILVNNKKNLRNRSIKSALKTVLKKFDTTVAEGNREAAESAYKVAVKTVDRAASKGLIHKKNAAHKKSSLTTKLSGMAE